jgi:hypothetical protein
LAGCSSKQEEERFVVISAIPANTQNMILLQDINTGDLICCSDTAYSTAEECAQAFEQDCYVRVQDIPYRAAQYDQLTQDNYPTRRWRENGTSARW